LAMLRPRVGRSSNSSNQRPFREGSRLTSCDPPADGTTRHVCPGDVARQTFSGLCSASPRTSKSRSARDAVLVVSPAVIATCVNDDFPNRNATRQAAWDLGRTTSRVSGIIKSFGRFVRLFLHFSRARRKIAILSRGMAPSGFAQQTILGGCQVEGRLTSLPLRRGARLHRSRAQMPQRHGN